MTTPPSPSRLPHHPPTTDIISTTFTPSTPSSSPRHYHGHGSTATAIINTTPSPHPPHHHRHNHHHVAATTPTPCTTSPPSPSPSSRTSPHQPPPKSACGFIKSPTCPDNTGFNSTLRQGNITHHEYIQVGKGRDVGLTRLLYFREKWQGETRSRFLAGTYTYLDSSSISFGCFRSSLQQLVKTSVQWYAPLLTVIPFTSLSWNLSFRLNSKPLSTLLKEDRSTIHRDFSFLNLSRELIADHRCSTKGLYYMLRRQHKVDDQHHDMPLIYYMEGHKLHFGRREFSLITGFCFGTVSFDLHSSSELKFRNRVFPNKIGFSITNLDFMGVIEDEDIFGKLSDDDAIRLCLLLALEVIFMGRLLTFNVDDTLFSLVENIEAWNSFPWGEHLWCHLYDEIKNLKERHGDEHYYGLFKDRNYVPTYTLSGFVFA
ncbi:phospholipase-like protein, partial [Tanacetum coccineum]